jgi:hypothetical protein
MAAAAAAPKEKREPNEDNDSISPKRACNKLFILPKKRSGNEGGILIAFREKREKGRRNKGQIFVAGKSNRGFKTDLQTRARNRRKSCRNEQRKRRTKLGSSKLCRRRIDA